LEAGKREAEAMNQLAQEAEKLLSRLQSFCLNKIISNVGNIVRCVNIRGGRREWH